MKKILYISILFLFSIVCFSCGESEDVFKKAAQGDAEAQSNLGRMYHKGEGVPQDYDKAVYWYTKAAEQGDTLAQYILGYLYAEGEGVPQDYKQAVVYWTKAAEKGCAFSQFNLGLMYSQGRGVPQNYKLAYAWYNLSAAQGHDGAIRNRDASAKNLSPQQLSEAQGLATQIQYEIDHPAESQKQESSAAIEKKG